MLGILYDAFRTLRMLISDSKGFIFFMDLLYFTVCAFLIFCFVLVVDSGRIRAYVILGELLGFAIYYFSFGAIAIRTSAAVISFFKKIFSAIFHPIKRTVKRIIRKFAKIKDFCKKNIRKTDKKAKYNLQKYRGIVYNLLGYNKKH
ncbi:MAG: spore cortex biosynthesis protein YabQ [Clostridia bacterium]|nr:spore cortex biosynthesis protein YabQ [Clostridia bacterium]